MAEGKRMPLAWGGQRIWGGRERLFGRVLPRLSGSRLAQLLQNAHQVDGIVKGLKVADWPADPWQALQRLALRVASACTAKA